MGSAKSEVVRKLVDVLLDLFPLAPMARKLFGIPIGYALDRGDANQKKTISAIAARIAEELSNLPDHDNPGSAISASHDVIDILRMSRIGPETLVNLDLDEVRVLSFLMAAAQPTLATAGQLRQGFIRSGLENVARTVVDSAPELPGVQLAFMRAMLRRRSDPAA
jgi:hypothetical protein